ncbi:MAG: hypothetical protein ABSG68_01605 [Thermoguttaceae bacterium]|jgi:hypothetical protein
MWSIVARAVLPVALCLGGIACLVYGTRSHTLTVVAEEEVEISIPVPVPFRSLPFGAPAGGLPPSLGAPFPPSPPGGPSFMMRKVKQIELVEMSQSEPALVREVTIGGVVLAEDGRLHRTYRGAAPALCPT